MKIAIFGTGYVGLVSGACLAQTGNTITCVDVDKEKIEMLKKGGCPIYEPGLEDLIKVNTKEERLFFTTNGKKAVEENDLIMIAVGTPPLPDGNADLSYIYGVARTIGENINRFKVVATKSTVPVGTGDKIERIIKEEIKKRKKKIEFEVVSNPEFLKEGHAVDDFMSPDRIILGLSDSVKAREMLSCAYAPFMRKGFRVIWMNRPSAELTKYAGNAMLATRISFINHLARLAEKVGADIDSVRQGIGSDSRIGRAFIFPSLGYGGSCFPKDVKALIRTLEDHGVDSSLIRSVENINAEQKTWFIGKILNYFKKDLKDKKIAVWGLAFKPETDDVRDSSAHQVIRELIDHGAKVEAFDPQAMKTFEKMFGKDKNLTYAKNEYAVLKDASALVIMTEWMQFRNPDFVKMKSLLKKPMIFDGRNLYDPKQLKWEGFEYSCVGRSESASLMAC